jgi:hypothetical protein
MDGGFADGSSSDRLANKSTILPTNGSAMRRFSRADSVPKKIVEH